MNVVMAVIEGYSKNSSISDNNIIVSELRISLLIMNL